MGKGGPGACKSLSKDLIVELGVGGYPDFC